MATPQELENKLERLEQRIQVMEDVEAIKKLKALYAKACDDKYNAELMKEVFTEDALWDSPPFGTFRGRDAICDFFRSVSGSIVFAIHYFMMPDITVEGNRAHARWYLWMAATVSPNRAVWLAALEDDKYEKISDRWWQTEMKGVTLFQTPYEEGWHKKRMID